MSFLQDDVYVGSAGLGAVAGGSILPAHEELSKSLSSLKNVRSDALHFHMTQLPTGGVTRCMGDVVQDAYLSGGRSVQESIEKTFTSGGDIVFGDSNTNAVRIESLDPETSEFTPNMKKFPFWMYISKTFVPNLQHYFVQEIAHGSRNSQFDELNVSEGDIAADEIDIQLRRRNITLRTISTRADVTVQAALVSNLSPGAQGFQQKSAVTAVIRENAHQLFVGDSSIRSNQYDGMAVQHYDLGGNSTVYSRGIFDSREEYVNSAQFLDFRGLSPTKAQFDNSTASLSTYFGDSDMLVMHPNSAAEFNTNANADAQRWLEPHQMGAFGTGFSRLYSPANSMGGTSVMQDQWVLPKNYRRNAGDGQANNSKAPNAPTAAVALAAPAADKVSLRKYVTGDAGLGARRYAISAINSYGESALTVMAANVTVPAGGNIVEFTITAPATTDPTVLAYRIFSSDPQTDPAPTQNSYVYEVLTIPASAVHSTATTGRNIYSSANTKVEEYGTILPNTSNAWLFDREALEYVYLIPTSVMRLATVRLSTPFTAFMVGALKMKVATKIVRFANVKLGSSFYNTNRH